MSLRRRILEQEATIASLRALLATATDEIEQLTTTISAKWVEEIDALTKENRKLKEEKRLLEFATYGMNVEIYKLKELEEENKKLKKENSENKALEIAFDIVKDENEVNKKNLKKMLLERPPLKSTDIVPPEKKNTKNEKGNRMMVETIYDQREVAYFRIPDGVDLEDKSVVESWETRYGTLYIKYVGKAEEEEIEWEFHPSEYTDYKYGQDSIEDADGLGGGCGVEYSDDEE